MANERVLPSDPASVHASSGTQDLPRLDASAASQPLARRSSFPPNSSLKRSRESALIGSVLLCAFLAQYWLALDWGLLSKWQALAWYKIMTGTLLATFVAAQWFLAVCRWQGWAHLARPAYLWHQRLGGFAALLLFAHSTALGFGYILMLSAVYLGNAALGMFSPQAFAMLRRYQTPWMAMHVALSVLLLVLMLYHAWTALFFE